MRSCKCICLLLISVVCISNAAMRVPSDALRIRGGAKDLKVQQQKIIQKGKDSIKEVKTVASKPVAVSNSKAAAPASSRLTVGLYFAAWYILNILYNVYNKKALNLVKTHFTVSAIQLLVGCVYVLPLWLTGLRKAPKLNMDNVKALTPIAVCHALSHACAVLGLGAGSVAFTHIVKAAEPFFTALFSAIFLKQYFPLPVYAALIPVVGGVAIASAKELNFSYFALAGAMGSNIAASSRGILAKKSMGVAKGENMGPANLYAVLTIMATAMLSIAAVFIEGPAVVNLVSKMLDGSVVSGPIIQNCLLSGLFFYLYNEVAFLALDAVHPVTHAVGNTIKRVFVIGTSVVVFKQPLTNEAIAGSSVAIIGVLVYSLLKDHYAKK